MQTPFHLAYIAFVPSQDHSPHSASLLYQSDMLTSNLSDANYRWMKSSGKACTDSLLTYLRAAANHELRGIVRRSQDAVGAGEEVHDPGAVLNRERCFPGKEVKSAYAKDG
jgi:hypothetical protein